MPLLETLRKMAGVTDEVSTELAAEIEKATLSTAARNDLDDSDFALPGRKYPIADESHARNALARVAQVGTPEEKAKVRAAVKRKFPTIDVSKAEAENTWLVDVPIVKNEEQRIVYGVVLNPEVRDSQGDIISKEEIEKTAHNFMTSYRAIDVQHSEVTKTEDGRPIAEPVESFIVPADMNFYGATIRKGAWVLGVRVNDDATWQEVKDSDRTGFSMAGTGTRLPD